MAQEYVKRFVTKDGETRINIYRDEFASNPRDTTDEPLHCQDWSREYSIETKDEGGYSYSDARSLLIHLLGEYGKREVIINMLVENGKHMTDGKSICNNALVYDRSLKGWELKEYTKWYSDKEYDWHQAEFFDGRKDDIDLYQLLDMCLDSTIDELCSDMNKYWTDGVKIASYGFGYYGDISFYDDANTRSVGICWLEKDEFLKYSGNPEDYWKGKTLKETEWLTDEIEAWSDNEVYGFTVEECIKSKIHKEYVNKDKEPEDYEEEEWEETDSCWGYYGELDDEHIGYILEGAGYKKEEVEEAA